MKRIITTIIILTIVVGVAILAMPHHKKPLPVVHKKPVPVQITHGVRTPYTDCVPNSDDPQEALHQQEIQATTSEMAKYNNVPDNTNNPDLQRLNRIYDQEIANYDTCTNTN